MPCKKNQQPPPICKPSSRRLLETVAIKDLPQAGNVCVPISNLHIGPTPYDCGPCACNEVDCGPGTCCTLNRHCESSGRSCSVQDPQTCLPNCKSVEIEAMIDEMKSCKEIIQTLALEAMEILHSEQDCPLCKQVAQAQNGTKAIMKGLPCEHCLNEAPANVIGPANQKSVNQSRTQLFAPPLNPCVHCTRNSSVPIAQTAFQIKEGRLPKTDDNNQSTKRKNTVACSQSYKKLCQEDSQTCVQKKTAPKPSSCNCEGEKNLNVNCSCSGKIDCRCGSKTFIQKMFGKKPSACSCHEDVTKQNAENEEKLSKTSLKNIFKRKNDRLSPEEQDKIEQKNKGNSEIEKRKLAVDVSQVEKRKSGVKSDVEAVSLPKCNKDKCQCHFPPSYNQYFTCTGQVAGTCSCNKND